jgi:hypothetical protein
MRGPIVGPTARRIDRRSRGKGATWTSVLTCTWILSEGPRPPPPGEGTRRRRPTGNAYPQQLARPKATPFDGTPFLGLAVIKVTPVSMYPLTFLPVLA